MQHDEQAAVGLARLAGILRSESANGRYWGAGEAEEERLIALRRFAARLLAEVDHRPFDAIEAVFAADNGLRTPWPGVELRITTPDGRTVTHRRRLRPGDQLDDYLAATAAALETDVPAAPVGMTDTAAAGLPCQHSYFDVYDVDAEIPAADVERRLPLTDADVTGPLTVHRPEAVPNVDTAGPMAVSPAAKAVLDEVAALAKEGRAATDNFYERERHERVLALCERTAAADLDYPRIDCGDLAFTGLPAGAEAAVFDDDGRLLLIRRTDTGQWAMPGGAHETGESAASAAAREAFEESGLRVRLTGLIGLYDNQRRFGDSRMPVIALFAARPTVPGQELRLAELEASEARWITADEVDGIDFYRGHQYRVPAAFAAR
jgi:ADP-ribose pyrophosphatase YjhB (NUDIX family)